MNRETCPNCSSETEFIQFGGEESKVTATKETDVDGGLLELRVCNDCGAAIENILTVEATTWKNSTNTDSTFNQ